MQTIGERLEEARKKKGISIREAAEATKIRGEYLGKFEGNTFDIGLTEIYTRGFLRNYANFLKLPADRILNDYAALGRSEVRPRQPSREVYGRMEISVASASESEDRSAPPAEATADPAAARGDAKPRVSRGGTALPTGPDPAVVFKYIKWGGIGVVALIALFTLKSLFTSSAPTPARPAPATANTPAPAAATPASAGPFYTLIALDTAFVRVTHRVGADGDGDEIFKGTLSKGQSQIIPWIGPQNVWASAGENVQLEFNGRRFPVGFTGYGHGHMENPPARK